MVRVGCGPGQHLLGRCRALGSMLNVAKSSDQIKTEQNKKTPKQIQTQTN